MASRIVVSGEQRGEYLPLVRWRSMIGRGENPPLQVLDDRVSPTHFRVISDKAMNKHYAEHMKSKHGTFLNMRKLEEKPLLSESDRIVLGETTLLFAEKDFDRIVQRPALPERHSTARGVLARLPMALNGERVKEDIVSLGGAK